MFHIKSNQRPISAIPGGSTWVVPSLQPTMSSTFPCRLAMLQNNFIGLYCRRSKATVLRGKGKVGVFQEEVSEDDQFAPEDGEGEFFGFAVGEEAQVEGFENWVVACGDRRSHVENRADLGAATSNVALAARLPTVAIEGRDAGQRRRLRSGQGAEFGHEGNQGGGTEGADALDLPEPLDFRGEVGRAGDFVGHGRSTTRSLSSSIWPWAGNTRLRSTKPRRPIGTSRRDRATHQGWQR